VAVAIRRLLEAAAFDGRPVDERRAERLIRQGKSCSSGPGSWSGGPDSRSGPGPYPAGAAFASLTG
jgi:hypothetical protein